MRLRARERQRENERGAAGVGVGARVSERVYPQALAAAKCGSYLQLALHQQQPPKTSKNIVPSKISATSAIISKQRKFPAYSVCHTSCRISGFLSVLPQLTQAWEELLLLLLPPSLETQAAPATEAAAFFHCRHRRRWSRL